MSPEVRGYLKTLRRIPADVVLRMGTRTFAMGKDRSCVCGWAIREALANGVSAERIDLTDAPRTSQMCADKFGGLLNEWDAIYHGVTSPTLNWWWDPYSAMRGKLPLIEEAFARRVAECV